VAQGPHVYRDVICDVDLRYPLLAIYELAKDPRESRAANYVVENGDPKAGDFH